MSPADDEQSADSSVSDDWPPVPTFSARSPIAKAALKDSLSAEILAELRRLRPITILISAPSAAWTDALTSLVPVLFPGARVVAAAKAPGRTSTPETPSPTGPIFAIATNTGWLSQTVVAGADFKVRLRIRPSAIAQAIADFCGSRRCRVAATDITGLDLPDIVYAMRPGSTPRQCIERLRRAVVSRSTAPTVKPVPKLTELSGYGAAGETIRRLAEDFERRRAAGTPFTMPGVLLHGEPGTGKTLLAQSFACSVNAPFISTSVAQWFRQGDGHLGDVATAAQRFFDRATSLAPSIALLDEIDAIPNRAAMDQRDSSWWTPIVTGLLVQIDELSRAGLGVVLIGATNHLQKLDSALVRPGRLEIHVEVRGPETLTEVAAVFRSCLGADLVDEDISAAVRIVGGATTGANIDSWVRLARAQAEREHRGLRLADLVDAIVPAQSILGLQLEEVALHEAAHAVVGYWIGEKVESASIISTDTRAGSTAISSDYVIFSRADLERKVIAMLAGRACDELLSKGATSGAASDIRQATALVIDIHARLGLGDFLTVMGPVENTHLALDYTLRAVVEKDLRRLLDEARAYVRRLEAPIRALAALLIRNRVVTANDISEVVGPRASSLLEPTGNRETPP